MDRKAVREGIENVLKQVDELEALVQNFQGDNELLHTKLNDYVSSLKDLHACSQQTGGQPVEVPVELLQYIDDCGNPDIFIEDVFKSCIAANEASRTKVTAFRDMRDKLIHSLQTDEPELIQDYTAIRSPAGNQ